LDYIGVRRMVIWYLDLGVILVHVCISNWGDLVLVKILSIVTVIFFMLECCSLSSAIVAIAILISCLNKSSCWIYVIVYGWIISIWAIVTI
jgi:hypothetical protein